MEHDEKLQWLREWCKANDLELQLEGNVGFGRECVGILRGGSYVDVDYGYSNDPLNLYEWRRQYEQNHGEEPPDLHSLGERFEDRPLGPDDDKEPNAYHKHDCLVILGRGEGAEAQLYSWVKRAVDLGARIQTVPRPKTDYDNPLSLLLHGTSRTRLTLSEKLPPTFKDLDKLAREMKSGQPE